jgi:hypothetical protein
MAKQPQLITLRVELDDITPAIWRRIEVDGDITLRGLHHIIQAAFGWTSSHLHEFVMEDRIYAMLDNENVLDSIEDLQQKTFDDRKAKLQQLAYQGQRFAYQYDFGDNWMHTVVVEKIEPVAKKMGCANIIDGQRACPPEDVGGVSGYEEFLTTIQQEPSTQHAQDYLRWIGGHFDSETFDRRAANSTLLRMGWNRWGIK